MMLKVLALLMPCMLLPLCLLAQNLSDFSSDNEYLKAAHSNLAHRLNKKFNTQHSKHAAYKTYLAQVLKNYYNDRFKKSEKLLADLIGRIEQKDLADLNKDLDNYTQVAHGDAWMMKKILRDRKVKYWTRYNLDQQTHHKYKKRFHKSIQLGQDLVTEATQKAHQEIVNGLDYVALHELYGALVNKNIIDEDDEYYTLPTANAFLGKGECTICLEAASDKNPLILLQGCSSHKAQHCLDCMKHHILEKSPTTDLWHIECPNKGCKKALKTCDVLHLFALDKATTIVKNSLSMLQRQNTQFFLCTHDGCKKGFKLRASGEKYFTCSHCNNRFCYDCGVENPLGAKCDLHRNVNGVGSLALMNVVQFCGRCGHGIVRIDGCSNVKCPCGNIIHYVGTFQEKSPQNNWKTIKIPTDSDVIVASTDNEDDRDDDDDDDDNDNENNESDDS